MIARARRGQATILWRWPGFALAGVLATCLWFPRARAESEPEGDEIGETPQPEFDPYSPSSEGRQPELSLNGYLDIGFALAQGDGTSFAPGDSRTPADYVTDTFATAVNSRGDVASTDTTRETNGFLPRSMGIGGKPSVLVNNLNQDLRFSSADDRVMIFARAQLLPRYGSAGNQTELWVEQAFARLLPFASLELALTLGRFDPVFGIEYLDNPSNLRVGVTPSLIARYTTGQCLGAKLFYRFHIPVLWSSFSFNISASNGGTLVEALQPVDVSLTGRPVWAGRFGYELGLAHFQLKLGASGLHGPRNDQRDSNVQQTNLGFDGRIYLAGLSLSGEWIYFEEELGTGTKMTGAGAQPGWATAFEVRGWYAQLAYRLPVSWTALSGITVYARLDHRRAQFAGNPWVETRRLTPGLRLDLWNNVAIKGEWLFNREAAGALPVNNDVGVVSMVFSW